MNCKEFLKELTDYLDGAIDARTKSELEEHLIWCHDCYVVCNTTKMTIEIYRDSEVYELPTDLRSRLQSAIMKKCKDHPHPPRQKKAHPSQHEQTPSKPTPSKDPS